LAQNRKKQDKRKKIWPITHRAGSILLTALEEEAPAIIESEMKRIYDSPGSRWIAGKKK